MAATAISGLASWERSDWLPSGDDLPDWLSGLRQRHLEAVTEYQHSISAVVDTRAKAEADNRAFRRRVRDAVAADRKPPTREHDPEIAVAVEQVADEDVDAAKRELAEVGIAVLAEIRERRVEFEPFFFRAGAELRAALGAGPDGLLTEADRQRQEQLAQAAAEPAIVDLSNPDHAKFVGEKEGSHAAA